MAKGVTAETNRSAIWLRVGLAALLASPAAWAGADDTRLSASVRDNAGRSTHSDTHHLVDAVGQGGTIEVSRGAGTVLRAGFVPAIATAPALSRELLLAVIGELEPVRAEQDRRDSRSVDQAIRFLEMAVGEFEIAAADGDEVRLVQVLNDVRQAIHFMTRLAPEAQGSVRLLGHASSTSAGAVVARARAGEFNGADDALALYGYGETALGHRDYRGALEYFKDAVETVKQV